MKTLSKTHSSWRRAPRLAALALTFTVAGCEGDPGPAGPQGEPGPRGEPGTSQTVDPRLSPVEKAFVALGGRDALQSLNSFTLESSGERFLEGEGFHPEDAPQVANSYQSTVAYDVAGDRLRVSTQRVVKAFGFNTPQTVTETLRGNVGVVTGTEFIFFPHDPSVSAPMTSDRAAALRRQQRLLNVHLLLKEVAATPDLASDAGVALLDGSLHHRVVVRDPARPVTLYVNASTGRVSRLETLESHPVRRDVLVQVDYLDWLPVAGGPAFPRQVFLSHDGHVLHTETRQSVSVNGALAATLFDFPAGVTPTFDATAAARGAVSHQWNMAWSSAGIPLDGLQTTVDAQELAPGILYLRGGTHHTLLVEQAGGLVLIEAPLSPERGEAVLSWVKERYPNRPITHVIASHFHEDHIGGLRTFVPEGARVVVSTVTAGFFRDLFSAPSTVRPDALSRRPTRPQLVTVAPDSSLTLADAERPVIVYPLESAHAADLNMVYLPSLRAVFIADIYSPGQPPDPSAAAELYRGITQTYRLQVDTLIGSHGGTGTFAALEALVNGTP
jgi:glyoxylase-like metal-dependent hydrolase (beta-lactamase superfamily II)